MFVWTKKLWTPDLLNFARVIGLLNPHIITPLPFPVHTTVWLMSGLIVISLRKENSFATHVCTSDRMKLKRSHQWKTILDFVSINPPGFASKDIIAITSIIAIEVVNICSGQRYRVVKWIFKLIKKILPDRRTYSNISTAFWRKRWISTASE